MGSPGSPRESPRSPPSPSPESRSIESWSPESLESRVRVEVGYAVQVVQRVLYNCTSMKHEANKRRKRNCAAVVQYLSLTKSNIKFLGYLDDNHAA